MRFIWMHCWFNGSSLRLYYWNEHFHLLFESTKKRKEEINRHGNSNKQKLFGKKKQKAKIKIAAENENEKHDNMGKIKLVFEGAEENNKIYYRNMNKTTSKHNYEWIKLGKTRGKCVARGGWICRFFVFCFFIFLSAYIELKPFGTFQRYRYKNS